MSRKKNLRRTSALVTAQTLYNLNRLAATGGYKCEKKCTYMKHELDCPYYNANARGDLVIDDQEERRERMWRQQEEEEFAAMMAEEDEGEEEGEGTLAASEEKEAATRSIEVITAEIWLYKQQAGAAILEIGRRLNEAKAQLSHGEWLPWLEEKVEFSEVTAQRFMRLAREYENPSLVTDLGASKALQLLALPASERDDFIAEKHEVNGQEKTVMEMSKRLLVKWNIIPDFLPLLQMVNQKLQTIIRSTTSRSLWQTHVHICFHYLKHQFVPQLQQMYFRFGAYILWDENLPV